MSLLGVLVAKSPKMLLCKRCVQVSLRGCCQSAEHNFVQIWFWILQSRPSFQKCVQGPQIPQCFCIRGKSSKILKCSRFWVRAPVPQIVLLWGLLWWVAFLFLAGYLHDGFQRSLDHNNQGEKRIKQSNKIDNSKTPNNVMNLVCFCVLRLG